MHITVCICTYKRPRLLKRLLETLVQQDTQGQFTYSVVVADNDSLESARETVAAATDVSPVRITYCVEPRQNIALVRNRAVAAADGDTIAFIDDDEFPTKDWLRLLRQTLVSHRADGVLGRTLPAEGVRRVGREQVVCRFAQIRAEPAAEWHAETGLSPSGHLRWQVVGKRTAERDFPLAPASLQRIGQGEPELHHFVVEER